MTGPATISWHHEGRVISAQAESVDFQEPARSSKRPFENMPASCTCCVDVTMSNAEMLENLKRMKPPELKPRGSNYTKPKKRKR